jgi:hypothetical protein|tara:strand:- start:9901 stop:10422 length:522 start_codon:yes stop_codon:yes gene_type:complete
MKTVITTYLKLFLIFVFLSGCTGEKQNKEISVKFPDTTPEEVIIKFFNLLNEGGRLTSEAALRMVSKKYGAVDPQKFRKWTEKFILSEIKPVETIMPQKPNKKGNWVAEMKLEVSTPSMFGDSFKTISRMNLILDQDAGEWKIDFFAETINEEYFRRSPAEAFAETKKGEKIK